MRLRWPACAALSAVVFLLGSCGGTTINPTPTVSALYPETIPATLIGPPTCTSNPSFTVNVSGNNFLDTSVVYWNGSKRATTFNQNSGELAVTILACDIANPGIDYVSVVNPPPGGGPSLAAAPFQVTQPATAAIKSLSPASTTQNVLPPGGTLTINGEPTEHGSNSAAFASDSQVSINGEARATTYVSATELQVQLLPSDVATVGNVRVSVTNPALGGSSSTAKFSVVDPPNAANFPRVISVSATGGAANGASSSPAMSADGRYVAFHSEATNLVASGASGNIFVRDTCIAAAASCTPHTIAVDLAPDGSAPNLQSGADLAISGNGRYIAFTSRARNLVLGLEQTSYGPEDSGLGLNVFVRDLCVGEDVPADCISRTSLVSETVTGEPTPGYAVFPSISADGRFVSFLSPDPDLAPGLSASLSHIFVRDTCAGVPASARCTPQTLVFAADSTDPAVTANSPMISANARYLTFEAIHHSAAGVPESSEVLLLDACLGSTVVRSCVPSVTEISVLSNGSPLTGRNMSPSVSGDGRFVTFDVGDSSAGSDVISPPSESVLRDTCLGPTAPAGCEPTTVVLQGMDPTNKTFSAQVDAAGGFVAFLEQAPKGSFQGAVTIRNNCAGATTACTAATYPLATAIDAQSPIMSSPLYDGKPSIGADGRLIAFSSDAANLASPTSGFGDVFLMQMPIAATQR